MSQQSKMDQKLSLFQMKAWTWNQTMKLQHRNPTQIQHYRLFYRQILHESPQVNQQQLQRQKCRENRFNRSL